MLRNASKLCALAVLVALLPCSSAYAADITHVLSAADGDNMWDFHLGVNFDQKWTNGQIQQEYHCSNQRPGGTTLQPGNPGYDANCGDVPRILSAKELAYQRVTSTLNIDAEFGLWRDVQFHIRMPIVLSDRESIKFAPPKDSGSRRVSAYCAPGDIMCSPSSIYRENADGMGIMEYSLFRVPADASSRGGIGDMTFGIAWSPYNQERDDTEATWKIQFDYTAPTGKQMSAKNTNVGKGLHHLTLTNALSRRFSGVDPYIAIFYTHVIPSQDSPFKKYGDGQTLVKPGDRFGLLFGTEFIPWENPRKHQKFAVDLGSQFVYQFEGRDYSPIYTFLGTSECNDLASCDLTKLGEYKDPQGNYIDNPMRTDGITDVEQYGQVLGWLGLNIQAAQYMKFRANVNVSYNFDHFLTNAGAGIDNGRSQVNSDGEVIYRPGRIDPFTEEVNPVFNRHLDPIGRRIQMAQNWTFSFWLTTALTF